MIKWIGGIFAALIVAYFARYLNNKSPDVLYTLSKGIPISFTEAGNQTGDLVQEVEVINIGNQTSRDLQIKISGNIVRYSVKPHSNSVVPKGFIRTNDFELLYPELPPQKYFSVQIVTKAKGITDGQLTIADSTGPSLPAFSRESSYRKTAQNILLMVVFLAFALIPGYSIYRDISLPDFRFMSLSKLLAKSRPFYIQKEIWDEKFKEAAVEKIGKWHTYDALKDTEAYAILSMGRPTHVTEALWGQLLEKAKNELPAFITNSLDSFSAGNLEKILKTTRPEHFPEDKWSLVTDRVSALLVNEMVCSISGVDDVQILLNNLDMSRPSHIPLDHWAKYLNHVKSRCLEVVADKLYDATPPYNLLKNIYHRSIFKSYEISILKRKVYASFAEQLYSLDVNEILEFMKKSKPDFFTDEEYNDLKKIAEQGLILSNAENLMRLAMEVINEQKIPSARPGSIDQSMWDKIIRIHKQINNLRKSEKENSETTQLTRKVSKQLDIINNLLENPRSFERIEEYQNPFSAGNYKALQAVYKLLIKS